LRNSLLASRELGGDGCDQHCVASQAFERSARLSKRRENRPGIRAFRVFGFVSRRPTRQSWAANCRKSPATTGKIPVLQRRRVETWRDHDCRPRPVGHYNNTETDPVRRLGVIVMENSCFSKAIALKMLPWERVRICAYVILFLIVVFYRKTDLAIESTARRQCSANSCRRVGYASNGLECAMRKRLQSGLRALSKLTHKKGALRQSH
jgi:hypothetical protein